MLNPNEYIIDKLIKQKPQHSQCFGMLRLFAFLWYVNFLFAVMRILLATVLFMVSLYANAQHEAAFPYPSIPDTLRAPSARAGYLVNHYWDGYNFADTTQNVAGGMAEQGFVNFLDLLPRVPRAVAASGMMAFVDRLYEDCQPAVRDYFAGLADSYLGNDYSPMRDDVLYAQFLDIMGASKFASVAERTRNDYMARNLRKNLPGTTAADFDYIDRHGKRRSLHSLAAPMTLLYFYDPDCGHCRQVLEQLLGIPQLTSEDGAVRVLAVYPYGYDERWSAAPRFPSTWIDGYSPDGDVTARDVYYIKSMPSLYLLDKDKKVVLKNPSVEVLRKALSGGCRYQFFKTQL